MAPGTKGESGDATLPLTNVPSVEDDAIKIFVRVRPPVAGTAIYTEGEQGLCLSVLSSTTIRLHSKPEPKIFTFDNVADMDTTQEAVFSSVAKNLVESCMNGYNGTIFAYGQTGSGKTFTMLGPSESDNFSHNLRGVIPRSFEYLFFLVNREKEKAGDGKSFLCKCSFIEIYNEQIFDLLDTASPGLILREHIKKGVFVVGAVEQVITSAAEAYQVLSMGWRNRRVASTSMNRESSRSHAVFTVTVQSMEKTNAIVNIRSSQLNLVDLAGSERQKDTHTEGVRLKEASSINRSLSCLGQVIMALVDVANGKQRHICYRNSKLTFLLRDSLGGNAKTYIIANVHPGSKCFGETLSTLHFAQQAKLIKNKAVINEDTQGNVRQLQAEIKKLKEQLAQFVGGQMLQDVGISRGKGYKNCFLEAMLFLEKSESEVKNLLQKVAQLEDLCIKKEKFIQSNKMIVKFREDYIVRLEKTLAEHQAEMSLDEKEIFISELKEEIQTLRDQVEHHPRVAKYAMENHSLREENKRLRSLQPVKRANEIDTKTIAELEKAFLEASAVDRNSGGKKKKIKKIGCSMSMERLKARLLQAQSELATSKQEYEEFKELTKKKHLELELEVRSLQKSNEYLENILEATRAHKRQEVSQLNKLHVETIKSITTPTKAYNLRSRLVARISPAGAQKDYMELHSPGELMDNIVNEPLPPEMNEQAYGVIAEELRTVQEQVSTLQTKLDEEENKSIKFKQQINKLEYHSEQMQEFFSSERTNWNKEQQEHLNQIKSLKKELQETQNKNDVLKSEVLDLRVVLQSADRELDTVKKEYSTYKQKQEGGELSQLSDRLINVQLQLDSVGLEHEKLLEEKRSLQDAYDNLQEVMQYEADQLKDQLSQNKQESEALQAELSNMLEQIETEKEHNQILRSQLQEKEENNSKELLKTLEENGHLKKQCCELVTRCEQQAAELQKLEQTLTTANGAIADLEKTSAADKEVVTDLMNQIQELRTSIRHKEESLDVLTRELEDVDSKYNSVLTAKEESKAVIEKQENTIMELNETLGRRRAADELERELLVEEVTHTSEQLGKMTEDFNKQTVLLEATLKVVTIKEATIEDIQKQLKERNEEMEKLKSESEQKLREAVGDSPVRISQAPSTSSNFENDLARFVESQEKDLMDQKASIATLEMLVSELNEERNAKNEEILRLKGQLCEMENIHLEMQSWTDQCQNLERQLQKAQSGGKNSVEKAPALHQKMSDLQKKVTEERTAKSRVLEKLIKVESELAETRKALESARSTLAQKENEVERTRVLETKTFQEKEDLRSKIEATFEEKDKMYKELEVLRNQVKFLAEENGKLLGHQNLNQKIQYMVKVKRENAKLIEEVEMLRAENCALKENSKKLEV
ncbi:kinesin-like protein KIF15 [Latimeria chalumnae]|uniref:kinesin-like protein KIF15 n=1 Tax=Latimeria chalumnae TaxID=7897 RepID=UPI00313D07A2